MYPSGKPYDSQAVDLFWKPFVRVFQVFCVSHYSLFRSNVHNGHLAYFIGFSCFHILIMTYTLKHGPHLHIIEDEKYKECPLMYYVSLMSIVANFATHTVANLETILSRKDEQQIYRRLREINEIFATKLNYVCDFTAIRQKFIRHTITYFILAGALSFGYSFFSLPKDGTSFHFLFCRFVAVVIIRVRRCQLAFHVNSLSNILMDLQILLKKQQQNYRDSSIGSPSRENIRYLRDIYSNVWLLKNLLNNCFGWSFITFLMEFAVDLINFFYWAYINTRSNASAYRIIRKCFSTRK